MTDIDEEGTDVADISSAAPLLYRNLWNSHIQRLVVGCHLLCHPIASVNSGNLPVGVPEPSATAGPCITTQDTDRLTKASNFRTSQSSQIYLIIISIWLQVGLAWVLKHLVTPITRGPVWHMFCGLSPSMSMWVNLISVYLYQLWCASRVSEPASQPHGKLAPYASSHISPSNRVPRLFACHGLQTYRPLSQRTERKISCMYKRGINSWCEYLIGFAREPRVAIRDSDDERNSSDGARESREKCWLRLGSSTLVCRRKQRQ